jgi:hypothetical protein
MMLSDVAEQRRSMTEELLRMQQQLLRVANGLGMVLKPVKPVKPVKPDADAPGGSKALETDARS